MKLRLLIISRVAGKREKVSVRGRDRLRYDIRAAVLTPGYEIARFRGTLSERTCTRATVHVNGRVCCAYLSVYYKETRAWNTHPSKSHGVAPWKLTAGNTKGRLTSERYRDKLVVGGCESTKCVSATGYCVAACTHRWMVRWPDIAPLDLNTG